MANSFKRASGALSGSVTSTAWREHTTWFHLEFSTDVSFTDQGEQGGYVKFATDAEEALLVKVGISYVSAENAKLNLETELPGWDFDAVRTDALAEWNRQLAKIDAKGGTAEQQANFYTAMYHLMFHPQTFSDVNGQYRGMDGKLHKTAGHTHYSVLSTWDTFRAAHPLYTLLNPDVQLDVIKTMLDDYRDSGWGPKWKLANTETQIMPGTWADVIIPDAYNVAHALGSSGGISRQTKVMPYLGGPNEPLFRRANENWRTLEKDSGQQVFHQCGYLQLGRNQPLRRGEGTEIELLDESALATRFPQFQQLPKQTNGILDHQGGLLRSELAIASHCQVALRNGAHIRAQKPGTDWSTDGDGVTVTTKRGSFRAKHLVIAAGAWNATLVPQLRDKLRVTRLSLGWFAPQDPVSFSIDNFPIWLHGAHYGFPVLPDFPGFKVAKHWNGDPTDPDKVDRVANASDEKLVRDYLNVHLPSANGSVLAFKVCMYTLGGPWLGPLPGEKRVTFIAACNGGGFKFSSAYGEALADLATKGKTELPIGFMKPRFVNAKS